MEYKDLMKKVAKMHNYYTNDGSACSDDCPLAGSNGLCKVGHSMFYLASESEPGLSDEIERIVSEWVKPVDWEAVAERAKTEDVKVLVWNNDTYNKLPRYFASYDAHNGKKFGAFNNGATRWSANPDWISWWEHAELVEEE